MTREEQTTPLEREAAQIQQHSTSTGKRIVYATAAVALTAAIAGAGYLYHLSQHMYDGLDMSNLVPK